MLTTERLTLVPHQPEHFDAYADFWGKDPGHFLRSLAPMHPADAWTRLLRHFGHWTAFGYGPFLCFDRDGRLVAEAGYADFRRGVGLRGARTCVTPRSAEAAGRRRGPGAVRTWPR